MTRILAADAAGLAEAAAILGRGGLVAFPTETVYGLGARAFDVAQIARVFAAKGRPPTHPLIVHVLDATQAARCVEGGALPPLAAALAARFWPGPLTLVLPRAAVVPAIVTGGQPTVALRAPAHPVARALLAAVGEPLAAPSANRYQQLSPTTAAHVAAAFGDEVELVLDGGASDAGIESSVVDLTTTPPTLLRPGALPLAALRTLLPDLVVAAGAVAPESAPRPSPGLDARHYAPRARLELHARAALPARLAASAGARLAVVTRATPLSRTPSSVRRVTLPDDPVAYAQALYATLHALDADCDLILVEDVPADDAWLAVADRLRRAAH